jgi:hypothetical protein
MLSPDWAAIKRREIAEAKAAYDVVEVGDFVNIVSWFGDVWAEVKSTYGGSEHSQASVTYYNGGRNNLGWDMDSMDRVRKVHKKGDPWDQCEARVVYTSEGAFGDRQPNKLPEAFQYQGPMRLEAWLWNYCGKNCTPKKAKNLQEWADKIGVAIVGVPHDVAEDVIHLLRGVTIKGWHPICRRVAEVKHDKAIWPNGK